MILPAQIINPFNFTQFNLYSYQSKKTLRNYLLYNPLSAQELLDRYSAHVDSFKSRLSLLDLNDANYKYYFDFYNSYISHYEKLIDILKSRL